jgi:hypothetical protein
VDAEPYGPAVRGLRRYLRQVCRAIGVGPEASCWELDHRTNAYIAVDGRLPGYPDHDFALVWDEENGWSAALENKSGEDIVILCYLGSDVLPPPSAVVRFVEALRADEYPGQPDAPALRASFAEDDFTDRLSRYLSELQPVNGR